MMMSSYNNLFGYRGDGASAQAQAVKAYLGIYEGIEVSYSSEHREYLARPSIDRWHNCREQGYVISLKCGQKQINIAFFEHRNSDEICALEWEQVTMNPPTIDNAKFGDLYKDKYDVSKAFSCGKAMEMADWIYTRLCRFWELESEKA